MKDNFATSFNSSCLRDLSGGITKSRWNTGMPKKKKEGVGD